MVSRRRALTTSAFSIFSAFCPSGLFIVFSFTSFSSVEVKGESLVYNGDREQGGHQRAGWWGPGAGRAPKSWVVGTGSGAGAKELGGGDREQGGRQRAGWKQGGIVSLLFYPKLLTGVGQYRLL